MHRLSKEELRDRRNVLKAAALGSASAAGLTAPAHFGFGGWKGPPRFWTDTRLPARCLDLECD